MSDYPIRPQTVLVSPRDYAAIAKSAGMSDAEIVGVQNPEFAALLIECEALALRFEKFGWTVVAEKLPPPKPKRKKKKR